MNVNAGKYKGLLYGLSPFLFLNLTAQGPMAPPPTIEVKVNVVIVPVSVCDVQGRPVGDLKKEDFRVFDQNKPRVITGFTVEKHAAGASRRENSELAPAPLIATQPSPSPPERFVVFMFDDLHLSAGDLQKMQMIATRALAGSIAQSGEFAVVSTSGASSGLTGNREKLEEAIAKLKSQPLYRRDSHACPNVDYYQADLIQNRHEYLAFEAAVQDALTCAHLDPRTQRNVAENMASAAAASTLRLGDQDVLTTLATLRNAVEKMASLPGQRILILLSPGFLTMTSIGMTEKSRILDLAARSEVTISALDARGLYTTELSASELGPISPRATTTGIVRYESQSRQQSMSLSEDVMGELADGTGGSFFHNNNDLQGGLERLTAVPEYLYLLQVSLDGVKLDGTYHHLKVKVDREGLEWRARRGYFASKPEKAKN